MFHFAMLFLKKKKECVTAHSLSRRQLYVLHRLEKTNKQKVAHELGKMKYHKSPKNSDT